MGDGGVVVNPLGDVVVMPLADLAPYPENARNITAKAVEQCAASIREFGWQQPMVADVDRVLVAGHVRHRAALLLGLTEGPVIIAATLSAAQIKAFRIADNRTHDYATWDYGKLASELAGLDDAFADVLDLADWQGIIDGFVESQRQDPLELGTAIGTLAPEHTVTVIFASREDADRAGPDLLKIEGVVDVRYRLPS